MEEEKKETESNSKWGSRKFIVWVTTAVLFFGIVIYSFFVKDSSLAIKFAEYYAWVSALYLGGNVAQDYIFKDKK